MIKLSTAMSRAYNLERDIQGPLVMAPKNLRQLAFTAEANVRLFDVIETQQLEMDEHTNALMLNLRDSVKIDRGIFSTPLREDEDLFLERMFVYPMDREHIAALWYSKVIGDVETVLCNAIPLTYTSTVFFCDRLHREALVAAFDGGTVSWSNESKATAVRNVHYAYTFLQMIQYGMSKVE